MGQLPATVFSHHRAIVALDIERSTSRSDAVKAELRSEIYALFDTALGSAGIHRSHRDRFVDRGDGILALLHPVNHAPKILLLTQVIPALNRLLTDYNSGLSRLGKPQYQLRVRVVVHAGEVHYDANGCFGGALDVAFRLLDAEQVKKALRYVNDPLMLVVSEDFYRSVMFHGSGGIRQNIFQPLVRVQVANRNHHGLVLAHGMATEATTVPAVQGRFTRLRCMVAQSRVRGLIYNPVPNLATGTGETVGLLEVNSHEAVTASAGNARNPRRILRHIREGLHD